MPSVKSRRFDRDVDGILLLDKPQGVSSNAALQAARGLYRARKAGHAGSLDPMATGMLPICFGEATKVCGFLLDASKVYRFTATLGQRTDSGDADGYVVAEAMVPTLTQDRIEAVLARNVGEQLQTPPMYSALKHQGERLYELARRGESVDREPRKIRVDRLQLLAWTPNQLQIEVACSKGTYVRTIAEDLAAQLGTLAHLTTLRRMTVGSFAERRMYSLDELERLGDVERQSLLLPLDSALSHLPAAQLDVAQRRAILHGQSVVAPSRVEVDGSIRLYGPNCEFLGLGTAALGGEIRPKRLVANRPGD